MRHLKRGTGLMALRRLRVKPMAIPISVCEELFRLEESLADFILLHKLCPQRMFNRIKDRISAGRARQAKVVEAFGFL